MLVEIGTGPYPVDHGEKARCGKGRQYAVPCAAQEVYALTRPGQKGVHLPRPVAKILGHDDEERVRAHRQEGLASERMALEQVEFVGQATRFGVEEADSGSTVAKIEASAVMVASAEPFIDHLVRSAGGIEHVAEGREGLGGQGAGREPHDSSAASRSSAIRSTCWQALANSIPRSLLSRVSKAASIPALSWSRTAMMKGKPCRAW